MLAKLQNRGWEINSTSLDQIIENGIFILFECNKEIGELKCELSIELSISEKVEYKIKSAGFLQKGKWSFLYLEKLKGETQDETLNKIEEVLNNIENLVLR